MTSNSNQKKDDEKMSTHNGTYTNETDLVKPVATHASMFGRGEWGGSETVLLVDDEELVLVYLKKALQRFGYQVITASSPLEAMEIFENDPDAIHLVVLDVIMPEMNGAQLLHKLKTIRPDIPALIISAFAEQEIEQLFPDGLSNLTFLQKPFVPGDLLSRLRKTLDDDSTEN